MLTTVWQYLPSVWSITHFYQPLWLRLNKQEDAVKTDELNWFGIRGWFGPAHRCGGPLIPCWDYVFEINQCSIMIKLKLY